MARSIPGNDPAEKERLRKKMALRMATFVDATHRTVDCVGGHWYPEPRTCELCELAHADELLVLRNRPGRKMHASVACTLEMMRFQVVDVLDLPRWLDAIKAEHAEHERKLAEVRAQEEELRKQPRVIVRRRPGPDAK